jgi:hypothetical protein
MGMNREKTSSIFIIPVTVVANKKLYISSFSMPQKFFASPLSAQIQEGKA